MKNLPTPSPPVVAVNPATCSHGPTRCCCSVASKLPLILHFIPQTGGPLPSQVVDAEGVRLDQAWRKTDGVFEHEAANEGIWKVRL